MSEFRDVCLQIKHLCQTLPCSECPMNDAMLCKLTPYSWTDVLLDKVDDVMKMLQSLPTIGQYLEECGVINSDNDDRTVVQKLYQTKVPMEWVNGETPLSAEWKNELRPAQADIDDAYYEYGRKHQEGKR